MIEGFAPIAASNNVILVAPQADGCWGSQDYTTSTKVSNGTKKGFQVMFVSKIIE
tara:strand:+ start:222 stop:386 length:165 start_codon:yes stop_codon:yes gene_type:complete